MRAASMTPLDTSDASTETLAANGGLDLPGRDRTRPAPVLTGSGPHEPIPGERDRSTLTHREPGSMGTPFNVEASAPPSTMTDATKHDRELEGGGEEVVRHDAADPHHREK